MSKELGQKIGIKFTEKLINNEKISLPLEYPLVKGYTAQDNSGVSSLINVPIEAQEGDLLLMFWSKDGNAVESIPEGWTRIFSSSDYYHGCSVFCKFYDGVTTSFSVFHYNETTAAIVFAIEEAGFPVVSGSSRKYTATPQPPELISGFPEGTPTLWFAFTGFDDRDVSAFPENFPDNRICVNIGYTGLGVASLCSTNISEAPGNFTISYHEESSAGTLALTFLPGATPFQRSLKKGFKIVGEEYKYINGPLRQRQYILEKGEIHPTESNSLLLTVRPQYEFNNTENNLLVSYEAQEGKLAGGGGPVESFETICTPIGLDKKLPIGDAESIILDLALVSDLQFITRPGLIYQELNNISVSCKLLDLTMTHIDDVNP